jgi:hypothetical protein
MKLKIIVSLLFLLSFIPIFGQSTFQKNVGVNNNHFHDLNIAPLEDGSDDFIVAGNIFDISMQSEQMTLKRVDINGNIIWINSYNHLIYQKLRGFDITINLNLIVATGSVDVNGVKKVFIITIDAGTGIVQNGMYYDIFDPILNSRGLHIVYTESDADGDSIADPGYIVGGFYSDCYSLDTINCMNLGFLLRTDLNLNPLWTTEMDSTVPNGALDYDFINHITETENGFFITGSLTNLGTLQVVLALKIDFQGNFAWNESYVFGNSKDLSVDAYYDNSTDTIYMLCNYSQSHYFAVTVLNNTTGSINLSNSWVATSANNFDVYGFTIMESLNSSDNLIVTGYDKEENWIDQDGTSQFGQNNLYVFEFNKATGSAIAFNYQYLVPHIEPIGDEFNFWNFQLPLIYYPDISFAKGFSDGPYYFHTGYRTESTAIFSETEIFKTSNDKLNNCEQLEINLTNNAVGVQNVSLIYGTTTVSATPLEALNNILNYTIASCDPGLSVGENSNNEIYITPNPATDLLNVVLEDKRLAYRIIDSSGKVIAVNEINTENPINVGNLNSGIYFIEITSDNYFKVIKFIKN